MHTNAYQIQTGWDVYGSDNEKIGDVAGVADEYFIIEKGFIFTTDLYVPMSAITSVQDEQVRLAFTKDEVEDQDWSEPPAAGYADVDDGADVMRTGNSHGATDTDRDVIERREERLTVDKTTGQAGSVRVGKHVEEDVQSVDVPVTREEVHLEQHAVDRPADGSTLTEDEIEVPVYEERVETGKEARVVEELEVEKTAGTDTERVEETIRHEEFDVDDSSGQTRGRS